MSKLDNNTSGVFCYKVALCTTLDVNRTNFNEDVESLRGDVSNNLDKSHIDKKHESC